MAEAEQGIHLNITGDKTSATSAVTSTVDTLKSLNDIVTQLSSTMQNMEASSNRTATAINTLNSHLSESKTKLDSEKASAEGVLGAFDAIGEHGRTLAIALDAVGV